jgi:hypothetical protein
MSTETDELRDFGRQENEYVLSGIFNPESAPYRHVDYVRKTAQDACSKAERTFGASDVLHIEALANLALFYWRRDEDPQMAAAPLERAKSLLSHQAAQYPEMATELIAVELLLHLLERRNESELGLVSAILDAAEFAWIVDRADEPTAAFGIVTQMIDHAHRTDHKILPYLVCEIGRPFAFDLMAQGRRSDAAKFLREILLPLAVEVWGNDSLQASSIGKEAGWIAKPDGNGIDRELQLSRMLVHVRNLVGELGKRRGRR